MTKAKNSVEKIKELLVLADKFSEEFKNPLGMDMRKAAQVLDNNLEELPKILKKLKRDYGFTSFVNIVVNTKHRSNLNLIRKIDEAVGLFKDEQVQLERDEKSILPNKIEGKEQDDIEPYSGKVLEAIQKDLEKATDEIQRREREYQHLLEKIDTLTVDNNNLLKEEQAIKVRYDLEKDPKKVIKIDLYKDEAAAYKEEIENKFFCSELAT